MKQWTEQVTRAKQGQNMGKTRAKQGRNKGKEPKEWLPNESVTESWGIRALQERDVVTVKSGECPCRQARQGGLAERLCWAQLSSTQFRLAPPGRALGVGPAQGTRPARLGRWWPPPRRAVYSAARATAD